MTPWPLTLSADAVRLPGIYSPVTEEIMSCLTLPLPPLLQQSIQRTIANGSFFSNSSGYGFYLPPPLGLTEAGTHGTVISSKSSSNRLIPASNPSYDLCTAHVSIKDISHTSATPERPTLETATRKPREWSPGDANTMEKKNTSATKPWDTDPDYQSDETMPANAMKRGRKVVLTAEQARDIYGERPSCRPRGSNASVQSESSRSKQLAERYNVSAKTIRDVWNRLTWTEATQPLWTDKEVLHYISTHNHLTASTPATTSGLKTGSDFHDHAVLFSGGSDPFAPFRRRPGRPKGIKDSRPRKVARVGTVKSLA